MIFDTTSVQHFLSQEFTRRVRLNPRYSLRAYSRSLGMSSGALSEILRAQRPLTLKAAVKIAKSLQLNSPETQRFLEFVEADQRKNLGKAALSADLPLDPKQKQLDEDTFHVVSEWHHFAILNLMDCEDFRWNANFIAKRLGLTVAQSQISMNLLLRLGLVEKKGDLVKCVQDFVLSPNGIPSAAVRQFHRQMLEKAIHAIEFQKIDERDMTGVGIAINPTHIPEIKREISEFQDKLIAKYSKGKRREVYFLETAFFKITQGEKNETK